MKKIIYTLLLSVFISAAYGQTLVSATQIAQYTAANISSQVGISVPYGVTAYKILYTTLGSDGVTDTASGLLCIPDDPSLSYPLLNYNHGTTNSKQDVPSNLQGGTYLSLAFSSQGYIVAAPDYLGMGESRGFHPYVHAQTQGQASVDLLFASRTYLNNNGIPFENQLFISGYSQGGHAGMATQKLIENQYMNDFNLTACGHMSGPYSISKVMKEVVLADVDYGTVAFIPYVIMGYQEVYGNLYNSLDEIFKAPYATLAQQFYNGTINLTNLNIQLLTQLSINAGNNYPHELFQDSIVTAIENDPAHCLNVALADNDVWNFNATVPTRMYYCDADEQVSYINALFADSAMNANGAADVEAVQVDPNQSHGGCAPLATFGAILFFDQYATIGLEESATLKNVNVWPNPSSDEVHIQSQQFAEMQIRVFDQAGRLLFDKVFLPSSSETISVSHWPSGLYLLSIEQSGKVRNQRLIIER
ncbi:MAG: T9SS type A sorting domain-containing protein [Flavobacteriales bacterium]|nr:T9SS type A sorting domain-containing protein [Flavobacteriales bacterium]